MPLPEGLARFNRVVTNRVANPFAQRLPGFAVLRHTGRSTGQAYETPLNAWREGEKIVVALTYGEDVDWLKNARASGHSVVIMRGEEVDVGKPGVVWNHPDTGVVPALVRRVLDVIDVDRYAVFPVL
ncbi:MAG: nitroreductase family deazaflavin-dependent oxidoreductase [Acidimicrobiia bacterium]|jgi:deazaflavin-dependent oxidoreductase (nitroreductase family)